jgi:hypothetical protein
MRAMSNIFESFIKPPTIKNLGLKRYLVTYSLNRLGLGVDNVRFDAHISPQVYSALKRTAFLVMIKHSRAEYFFKDFKRESCEIEKETLKRICTDILQDGINRANATAEVQIDFLGQAALAKLFLEEIKEQYKKLVAHFEPLVRTYQLSQRHDRDEGFLIKDKLADIKRHRDRILRSAGEELFQLLADINAKNLRNLRETHFAMSDILPDNFFINPLLHTDNPADDFFLVEEYVLLGQRAEDPDNYNNVKQIINELLGMTDFRHADILTGNSTAEEESKDQVDECFVDTEANMFDSWIMDENNVDRMFNWIDSKEKYEMIKRAKGSKEILQVLKQQINTQQKLLNLFYRRFKKSRLIRQIVAAFEMKAVYGKYCPPMAPRQIREFMVDFWSRISITHQLKRRKYFQGKSFPLQPLQQTVTQMNSCPKAEKKKYLQMFLKQFFRYHRDLNNCRILKDAMDSINLVTEEKIILLSRENRSLFEFLLPDERVKEEKPVINHVIIKADIRGSMEINQKMKARGLNPASYFSLNFFDPISAVLAEYDAAKVFIEGDAIILSIFENGDATRGSYSVARACGLAIRILQIVNRYNENNKENNLPILELGIGICYSHGPPDYLFDGDSRIMISPAINLADRLSSCDKKIRNNLTNQNPLFNLFVFKNAAEKDITGTAYDFPLRYNVNGIELSEDSFNKLTTEINLKTFMHPAGKDENVKLYAGKVPTVSGNYQKLTIREATIYAVNPDTMEITGKTTGKYYEVCVSQEIYNFIDNFN